jgi:hypothetical protein
MHDDRTLLEAPLSIWERMVNSAAGLSTQRAEILCKLLRATCEIRQAEGSALRSIWAAENLARGDRVIQLLALLDRIDRTNGIAMIPPETEHYAADRLAAGLCLLQNLSAAEPVPCSAVLRHVVHDLMALFGPVVGGVIVVTRMQHLAMANDRRRALVLAACNILLHAISLGFDRRVLGRFVVSLERIDTTTAQLTIANNGGSSDGFAVPLPLEPVGDLAAFLEGRFSYRQADHGGTIAVLAFPVEQGSACAAETP